ncbi:hypothetical protein Lser_V15G04739 [Lactuca serriola]
MFLLMISIGGQKLSKFPNQIGDFVSWVTKPNLPVNRLNRLIILGDEHQPDYPENSLNHLMLTPSLCVCFLTTYSNTIQEMRGIELSLNQTQKLRLQRVLELLESMSSGTNYDSSVTVADSIHVKQEDGVLKGHGTTKPEGEVVTTVCGVIERVNKLVYVRTLRARYKPEVGDIIVAHVIEVAPKRWRLEINFSQDAVLMLSLMNLPDRCDGLQLMSSTCVPFLKRMTSSVAEVRDFMCDGNLQLQARSQKYGKPVGVS